MPINIIVTGCLGKVGKEIATCITKDAACRLAGCIERPGHPLLGKDYGDCAGLGTLGIPVVDSLDKCGISDAVVIDFTSPQATKSFLSHAGKNKLRFVIGTTGIDAAGRAYISEMSKNAPIMFSPNMSLGVNLLFILTELVAKRLGETFDIEIIEAHHRFKRDSPSGTAVRLGEIAAQAIDSTYDEAIRNGRAGMVGERTKKEIGMHAVRGGDIVGDHTVLFAGMGERIELRHAAHSRTTFAHGAVTAAKWVSTRENGLFSMRDVLGL